MKNFWLEFSSSKKIKYSLESGKVFSIKGDETIENIFSEACFKMVSNKKDGIEWVNLWIHESSKDIFKQLNKRLIPRVNTIDNKSKLIAEPIDDISIFAKLDTSYNAIEINDKITYNDTELDSNRYKITNTKAQYAFLSGGITSLILYGDITKEF